MDKILSNFLDKIKAQSTLIVGLMLIYAFFALKEANSNVSFLVLTGITSFCVAILLGIGNFFGYFFSENHKYIIDQLKGLVKELRSSQNFSDKRLKNYIDTTTTPTGRISPTKEEYKSVGDDETTIS